MNVTFGTDVVKDVGDIIQDNCKCLNTHLINMELNIY